jgi:hypothetical protein
MTQTGLPTKKSQTKKTKEETLTITALPSREKKIKLILKYIYVYNKRLNVLIKYINN